MEIEPTSPIVRSVSPEVGLAVLQRALEVVSESSQWPASLHRVIAGEESKVRWAYTEKLVWPAPTQDLTAGPVVAILLDPVVGGLAGEERDARLRQIISARRSTHRGVVNAMRVLVALVFITGIIGVAATFIASQRVSGLWPYAPVVLAVIATMMLVRRETPELGDVVSVGYSRISLADARQLAELASETGSAPPTLEQTPPPGARRLTIADIHQTREDLLAQWSAYRLDPEAWYITKPLLHDTTGTVATTVAYERALQNFIAAVDDLPADPEQSRIDAVGRLADIAWAAWHKADDYAAHVGLGDRSPTERAALQRLGKLVERLTHSSAADPELASIKRAIQECLDKITTVSASWADIAALPAIESNGLVPQIPAKALDQSA